MTSKTEEHEIRKRVGGTWRAEAQHDRWGEEGDWYSIRDEGDAQVAVAAGTANAQAISALPDLLAALEEFLECAGFDDDPVRIRAQEAVKRARGEA